MQAYREGATGNDVLAKTKAIKKRHRAPLVVEQQPRVGYDRSRGRRALEEQHESEESESERSREDRSEIVFSQEEFASKLRKIPSRSTGAPLTLRQLLENMGKHTRVLSREAPRMDYLDVQLHFDQIVEDNRQWEAYTDGRDVTYITYDEEEWSRRWEDALRE